MTKKNIGLLYYFTAFLLVVTYAAGFFTFLPKVFGNIAAKAEGEVVNTEKVFLEGSSDKFLLSEESNDVDASFVYSARVSFESGQAAGIVFGAKQDTYYWVLNVDRFENQIKLMYFDYTGSQPEVTVLANVDYIGNDKATQSERDAIKERLKNYGIFSFKIVITVESDNIYAEFFVDEIKRFGTESVFNLNDINTAFGKDVSFTYQGGNVGFNVFNSKVEFDAIRLGASDYGYYTELYRQQYHFSQFKNWNNDPNGLVYYNGYYHLFYQHNPYSVYWGDMYWGHARSRDLLLWEHLPICLFPDSDSDWGSEYGKMWSGSAMVYRKGMSKTIDDLNWFENGEGTGLIAYYTRDSGREQNQIMMSSDDEGLTWTKRKIAVNQNTVQPNHRIEFRDPKVFPIKTVGGKVTLWGMVVAGGQVHFYVSENLYDWVKAGELPVYAECPDLYHLPADDGDSKWVLQLASRTYIVGEISYNASTRKIDFVDLNGVNLTAEKNDSRVDYKYTEYGKDSYAAQTFYIDDAESEYYKQTVAINWFSGVPNDNTTVESGAAAEPRDGFNGGGMTIPVVMTLKEINGDYILKQTPIIKDGEDARKTKLFNATDIILDGDTNPLEKVKGHQLEISVTVENIGDLGNFGIRVNKGVGEYTEIGYDQTEGYYVDRTNSGSGGANFLNYHQKYYSKQKQSQQTDYTFYILIDSGGVEVFCDDLTVPMYFVTFASPYADGLELFGAVKFKRVSVNRINNTMKKTAVEGETVLYVSTDTLTLDTTLNKYSEILAYSTGNANIEWAVANENVVTVTKTESGAIINAVSVGSTDVTVSVGDIKRVVSVTVLKGSFDTDLTFKKEGIISGDWYLTDKGLVGHKKEGDGYILSDNEGGDFTYTARFDLGDGAAAALIFRASSDMKSYYMANYDHNGKVVKLWSERGELGNVGVEDLDKSDIVLSVTTKGNEISVAVNGNTVISATDSSKSAPLSGKFGLNICATSATFKSASIRSGMIEYNEGDLVIESDIAQSIVTIYNFTLGNSTVPKQYYTITERKITILSQYMLTLKDTGVYEFIIEGAINSFSVKVDIKALPQLTLLDKTIENGQSAVIFIGAKNIVSISVNGTELENDLYSVSDYVLTISKTAFIVGENTVTLNLSGTEYEIKVIQNGEIFTDSGEKGCGGFVSAGSGMLFAVLMAAAVILLKRRRNGSNN